MITRSISLSLAALVGLGLAIGTSANAQVIVQTFTIPTQSVPFNINFTFNKFDSSLGTLGLVQLDLATSITAEVDVFNSTNTPQNFTNDTASIPVTLTGPGPVTETATATAGPINGTVPAGPVVGAFPGITANANNSLNINPLLWIPNYEGVGPGTGTLNASSTSGSYAGTANTGVFFGGSATAGGTITLRYFYQPAGTIPEPGTTTFLAAGVLGSLGMVLRRRKNKK